MIQLNVYKGRFMPKKQVKLAEINKRPLGLTIPLSNIKYMVYYTQPNEAKSGESW